MAAAGPRNAPDVVDVVALGESMVTFLPSRPGRLADVPSFDRAIGGAESNVVCALAAAGHSTRWVGRVGADGFGDHLVEAIGSHGVDVTSVRRDADRPTGVYFRTAQDRTSDAHEVAYYRAGSAASAMSAHNVDLRAARAGRVLHLTGITAALSGDCRALLRELITRRPPAGPRPLVSFDVNHRPALWRDADGPRVLRELAQDADIVFVGEDEAREVWGLEGPEAVRAAFPGPAVLVVKQGDRGATAFAEGAGGPGAFTEGAGGPGPDNGGEPGGGRRAGTGADGGEGRRESGADGGEGRRGTGADGGEGCAGTGAGGGEGRRGRTGRGAGLFVPALRVEVVAAVGAGDAFAAGFLSATLRGLPLRDRLRHGHLMAAAALTAPGDLAVPATRDHADRLAALDDTAWGRLRPGPGWTAQDAPRAPEEARTP
ncbi:sugar kinase [Streptomyces sp. NPDC002265]|uniref:sugar kinase n=1 Tax=Streptomyces sp. NPDC002265 TaxID=3154415 RepID=UPI003317AADA